MCDPISSFMRSKNLIMEEDLNKGLVCSKKGLLVMILMALFCKMNIFCKWVGKVDPQSGKQYDRWG